MYRPLTDLVKHVTRGAFRRHAIDLRPGPLTRAGQPDPVAVGSRSPVTVCLTHDVDTAACAGFLPRLADLDEGAGLRSTFNVLTEGPYSLEPGLLDDLERRGFEIGLHGDDHDLGFGFHEPSELRRRLTACLDRLERGIAGYRAPALSLSEPLLGILDELGFRYDSSVTLRCLYRSGVSECVPYVYPGTSLWELPLAIQDDALFRDWRLSDEQALAVVDGVLAAVRPFAGLVVVNTHPIHIRDHPHFYRQLTTLLASTSWIRVLCTGELVRRLDAVTSRDVA